MGLEGVWVRGDVLQARLLLFWGVRCVYVKKEACTLLTIYDYFYLYGYPVII